MAVEFYRTPTGWEIMLKATQILANSKIKVPNISHNAINTRHCMRFKTSFIHWLTSNFNQNFVCILDSTALAPYEVHHCLTYSIILGRGGLRETDVRISAKAIALPYRNVCSSLFIVT